jgi:hypothetical protein
MAGSGDFAQADDPSVYYAMAIIWPQMVAVLFTVGGFYIIPLLVLIPSATGRRWR